MKTASLLLSIVLTNSLLVFGADAVPELLKHKMASLSGKEIELSQYAGKVILVVNVASKCGHTPQYKSLQALHERYKDQGLVVLGVPCNQFGGQEPGASEEIASFCQKNYGVTFDMLGKVDVNGEKQAPLFKQLTSGAGNEKLAAPVKWNFEKFVIGRNGQLVTRFASGVKPDSADLTKVIEAELAKKSS